MDINPTQHTPLSNSLEAAAGFIAETSFAMGVGYIATKELTKLGQTFGMQFASSIGNMVAPGIGGVIGASLGGALAGMTTDAVVQLVRYELSDHKQDFKFDWTSFFLAGVGGMIPAGAGALVGFGNGIKNIPLLSKFTGIAAFITSEGKTGTELMLHGALVDVLLGATTQGLAAAVSEDVDFVSGATLKNIALGVVTGRTAHVAGEKLARFTNAKPPVMGNKYEPIHLKTPAAVFRGSGDQLFVRTEMGARPASNLDFGTENSRPGFVKVSETSGRSEIIPLKKGDIVRIKIADTREDKFVIYSDAGFHSVKTGDKVIIDGTRDSITPDGRLQSVQDQADIARLSAAIGDDPQGFLKRIIAKRAAEAAYTETHHKAPLDAAKAAHPDVLTLRNVTSGYGTTEASLSNVLPTKGWHPVRSVADLVEGEVYVLISTRPRFHDRGYVDHEETARMGTYARQTREGDLLFYTGDTVSGYRSYPNGRISDFIFKKVDPAS